jgi:hypothetical protein
MHKILLFLMDIEGRRFNAGLAHTVSSEARLNVRKNVAATANILQTSLKLAQLVRRVVNIWIVRPFEIRPRDFELLNLRNSRTKDRLRGGNRMQVLFNNVKQSRNGLSRGIPADSCSCTRISDETTLIFIICVTQGTETEPESGRRSWTNDIPVYWYIPTF